MPTGTRRSLAVLTALALATGGAVTVAQTASAIPDAGELVHGLTTDNRLVSFRSAQPGNLLDNRPITLSAGAALGTDLVGIDVRPRTGELYALGMNEQLYVINPSTGVATPRGSAITPELSGTRFGFDFNPVADRIRIISDTGQNLRVNPETGGASAVTSPGTNTDGPLRYNDSDPNAGVQPQAVAAAYTNSVDGASTTAQFAIDAGLNTFVQQDSNRGVLTTVGNLNQGDVTDAGLDISPATDTTLALLTTQAGGTTTGNRLFTVDRSTGAATLVGQVGAAATPVVEDLAISSARFLVTATTVTEGGIANVEVRRVGDTAEQQTVDYAVASGTTGEVPADAAAASGRLTFGVGETTRTFAVQTIDDDFTEGTEVLTIALSAPSGGAVASNGTLTITDNEAGNAVGLTADNRLVDFSVRTPGTAGTTRPVLGLPSGVTLVGIDVRPRTGGLYGVGTNNQIYLINRTTGVATSQGTLGTALNGNAFGVDFNPVADRLRIVSDLNQNLRVNVDSPAEAGTVVDGTLRYAEGDPNVGTDPVVVAAAYTNSFNSGTAGTATPTATMQFDIDAATRALVRQDSNPGLLLTRGALGLAEGVRIGENGAVGLDIAAAGNAAFASFGTSAAAAPQLYRVDLESGRATSLGALATPASLSGSTTIVDFALLDTERSTFTAPGSSPSPTASATPTATASPTGTAQPTVLPTLPGSRADITLSVRDDTIVPTEQGVIDVTAEPNSIVIIQAYSRPNTDYRPVRRVQIGEDGTAVVRILPGTNTRLYGEYEDGEQDSRSVVQNVATAMSLTVVRNGSLDYTFQGRILPRRAGQLITLYRIDDGREVITSQIRTDDSGTYRIRRIFQGQGVFGFLTRTGQNLTNVAGVSNDGRPRPTAIYAGPQR